MIAKIILKNPEKRLKFAKISPENPENQVVKSLDTLGHAMWDFVKGGSGVNILAKIPYFIPCPF